MLYYGIFIALMAGVFIAVQGSINSMAGSTVGVFPAVIIPVWSQMILLTLALLLNGKFMAEVASLKEHKSMILWLVISGLLGIGIMTGITMSFMKIGPLLALSLIVFSQLMISMIVEHYGFFGANIVPMSIGRLAGLGAIMLGVFLFSK